MVPEAGQAGHRAGVSPRHGAQRVVTRAHVTRVPGTGGEAHAGDGRGEALTQGDEGLHLVDPLALAPFVLEPDLDDPFAQPRVFGQLFKHLWCGLWVLIEHILKKF